jgi:3-hydroxyisobutyrate dehydrogenase-like beta-hydroxyacid dehydrogenase
MEHITVIGLGNMGSTIARLLLRSGYRVTVWNRSRAKAEALVQEGAVFAPDVAAAIAASPLVIVCVHDYRATEAIFAAPGAVAALDGRTLVQLTTGSPQEARDSETWARAVGAAYLDGAIQAAPGQMGQPDTPLLVSGARSAFDRAEPALKVLAGNVMYLGEAIGAAGAMDLATLSYIYGAVLGFIHGARVAEAEGLNVDAYGQIVADISPSFGQFLKYEGHAIHTGDFASKESPLSISVEATRRLLDTARAAGINSEFPALAAGLLKRADEAGYGKEELAALIKVLRGDGVGKVQ